MVRLVLFAILFAALTAAGVAWAIHESGTSPGDLRLLLDLPPATLALALLFVVLMHVADWYRYRIFGRVLGVKVSARAAVDAVIGNDFFSWITPGAALGIPAAIYMLGRRGVPWDAAALICYAKSMTGVAFLIAIAFVAFLLGLGPADLDPRITAFLLWGTGITALTLLVLVFGAFWPDAMKRWIERVPIIRVRTVLAGIVDRLANFRGEGFGAYAALTASHVPYFACFIGVTVVFAMGLGGESLYEASGASTVYLAVLYLAPTPGASGISEATAVTFFGDLLTPTNAVVCVIASRIVTLYFQLAFGLVYLSALGAIRGVLQSARDRAR